MIENIQNYFRGVASEFKKITWPTRKTVVSHTVIVISSIVGLMLVFGAIDLGFSKILEIIVSGR